MPDAFEPEGSGLVYHLVATSSPRDTFFSHSEDFHIARGEIWIAPFVIGYTNTELEGGAVRGEARDEACCKLISSAKLAKA